MAHQQLTTITGSISKTHTHGSLAHLAVLSVTSFRIERHIFPDIVADVHYDTVTGACGISGQGVEPALLMLKNPSATDDQIMEELYMFPIINRAHIHR